MLSKYLRNTEETPSDDNQESFAQESEKNLHLKRILPEETCSADHNTPQPTSQSSSQSPKLKEASQSAAPLPPKPQESSPQTALERGRSVLLKTVKKLPHAPGVYRMLGKEGELLYIGKAKDLKNRVTSYTQVNDLPYRTRRMVSLVEALQITLTSTESEALFLEADLIRTLKPPFNVLLKDSSPFVSISIQKNHPFPAIHRHRGPRDEKNEDYLGPFSSIKSVDEALLHIQKIFQLRTCAETMFVTRKRPCLLYDMKRCSAPCVHKIAQEEYQTAVARAKEFLAGKMAFVRNALKEDMVRASDALKFEKAARLRDTLQHLEKMTHWEKASTGNLENADVVALFAPQGPQGASPLPEATTPSSEVPPLDFSILGKREPISPVLSSLPPCVHVLFIRHNMYLGGDTFFLSKTANEMAHEEIMATFLQQFYFQRPPPKDILVNVMPHNAEVLRQALKERYQKAVTLRHPQKGNGAAWMERARVNALQQSQTESLKNTDFAEQLAQLAQVFALSKTPRRVEIYDNSHLQGTNAYGCMVVATAEGFDKKAYRQFSVESHKSEDKSQKGGSDFAMMEEMMRRRFRPPKEDLPDLLIIDGGAGQISSVLKIFEEYDLSIPMIGVAKGPDRNAGRERFFLPGWVPFSLPEHDPLLHFIQRLRDEAHRFAIGTHRKARSRDLTQSQLSDIPGVGAVRKKELLKKFGSVRGVKQASLEELKKVKGMTDAAAKKVYQYFQ
ncbi:UvrABC system protein C [Alphaproteobacteria bacterium]|nr:UvrABC system protein C [Alphaproteobacteria bacterium]GHS97866.1 UvrABC system protein C [Alphaproteobacteria bacterium]